MTEVKESSFSFSPWGEICPKSSFLDKVWYSFLSALVFIIVANPLTYQVVRSLFNLISGGLWGKYITNASGKTEIGGLLVHAFVFMILILFLMLISDWMN